MDIDRFIRLRSTVVAAADDRDGTAAPSTYEALRVEIRSALPDELTGEFDRLFGQNYRTSGTALGRAMAARERAEWAMGKLRAISGYLNGIIESAQAGERMRLEAEAYARERVKTDRGLALSLSTPAGVQPTATATRGRRKRGMDRRYCRRSVSAVLGGSNQQARGAVVRGSSARG